MIVDLETAKGESNISQAFLRLYEALQLSKYLTLNDRPFCSLFDVRKARSEPNMSGNGSFM